jgi:hypothetical protein
VNECLGILPSVASPLRSIQSIPRPGLSFEAPLYGWQTTNQDEIAKAIDRAVSGALGDQRHDQATPSEVERR